MRNIPNYKKIYSDMIAAKYPEKSGVCSKILKKNTLHVLDVIMLNGFLTDHSLTEKDKMNQKLKSYDQETIFKILEYQKKYQLNNIQLARHFKMSRNTVTKWKKLYFSKKLRE